MMDEVVHRMAAAAQVNLPYDNPAARPTAADHRMGSLSRKLAYFEQQYSEGEDKKKKAALKAIDDRLTRINKAVAHLRRTAKAQSIVTRKLIAKERARDPLNTVIGDGPKYDVAVGLPKDFEKKVSAIIKTIKLDAGKVYRRGCSDGRPFCKVVRKAKKSEEPLPAPKAKTVGAVKKMAAAAPTPPPKKLTSVAAPVKKLTTQQYVDNGN